jgi:hypothetical protein
MSLLTLSNRFGALNNRAEPHIIGPNAAQALSNVVLDSLGIVPQKDVGSTVATGSGTARSLYKFSGQYIISTEARQYVEYGGQLIYCVDGQAPKRSADGITFYNLGLKPPQIAPTAAVGAAGVLTGSYSYYVTFTGTLGGESGYSPAGSVTLTADQADLTAIPTHLGTGSITTGSPTVTGVTNIGAYQVGMNVIGQDSAAASAPAAGVGIPAGTTIISINTGASTITLSANATATTAGIRITDPQYIARKIYRAGGGQVGTNLIATLSNMTTLTYTDNTADQDVGAQGTVSDYDVPPLLSCIATTPENRLVGASGSTVYYAEASLPSAWKATSSVSMTDTVVGLAHHSGNLLVLTTTAPSLILGTSPTTYRVINLPSQQGCLGRDTIADMGDAGVFWLSPDGLCAFSGGAVDVISKGALSDAFMAGVAATNAKAARYNERYILFVQSGASFASGGYLEWDSRTLGNWKTGSVTANAAAYSRTDDLLYVAQTAAVKAWEGGAAGSTTCSYQTGDWIDKAFSTLKHWRGAAVDHNGTVSATVYVDGVQVGSVQTLVRTTLGRSFWRLPAGSRGRRISIKVAGTGTTWRVVEILAEAGDVSRKM